MWGLSWRRVVVRDLRKAGGSETMNAKFVPQD